MFSRRLSFVPFLFVALWCLWFVLPQTRDVALSQWKARLQSAPVANASPATSDTSRDAEFVRALSDPARYSSKRFSEKYQALQKLAARYPNDASICAAQILPMCNDIHLGSVRQAGPSSSADLNWSVKLTKVEEPDPQVLRAWFEATKRGAKLEPNNTFWDWTLLIGLLASRRDSEVWDVIRKASTKTAYDDHASDGSIAQLKMARLRGAVSPIGQVGIYSAVLFPQYATMREAARQVSDGASGLRLTDEPAKQKQALEGLRNFARMARVMRRESKSSIGSLVGTAIESIALYGGSYSPTAPKATRRAAPGAALKTFASDRRSLIAFAKQQGRNDIVNQVSQQWVEMGTWRTKTRAGMLTSYLIGVDMGDFGLAQGADWFGSLFIATMPILLAVAVGCTGLLYLVPMLRRERDAQPSAASWVWGPLLSFGAVITLTSAALYMLYMTWGSPGMTLLDLLIAVTSGNNTGSIFGPLIWQYNFPALLAVIAALWMATTWDARRQGYGTLWSQLRGVFSAPDDGMARFDIAPLLILASTIGGFCLITGGVLAFLIIPSVNSDYRSLHEYAGLFLVAFAIVLGVPCLLRLRTYAGRAFALILARRFAWGQLLFLTIVWGLLWLAAQPAQKRFDAELDKHIQVGEFQLIRKKVGL